MLGEKFQGRPHNGSDDALNIAKVVISLLKDGGEAIENERILLNEEDQLKNGLAIQNDRRIWFGLDTVQNITRKDFLIFNRLGDVKRSDNDNSYSDEASSSSSAEEFSGNASGSDDSGDLSGKENIDDTEDDDNNKEFIPFQDHHHNHNQREYPLAYSEVAFSPPGGYCPVHGPTCYYGNGVRAGRCSSFLRVSNQILGHHYLPANHIYHPKYPVLYPLSRRSNYTVTQNSPNSGSDGSTTTTNATNVPLSRAQRPPGMLRRAVEATIAASENVH